MPQVLGAGLKFWQALQPFGMSAMCCLRRHRFPSSNPARLGSPSSSRRQPAASCHRQARRAALPSPRLCGVNAAVRMRLRAAKRPVSEGRPPARANPKPAGLQAVLRHPPRSLEAEYCASQAAGAPWGLPPAAACRATQRGGAAGLRSACVGHHKHLLHRHLLFAIRPHHIDQAHCLRAPSKSPRRLRSWAASNENRHQTCHGRDQNVLLNTCTAVRQFRRGASRPVHFR